jgi:hypothetical protein
VIRHNLLFWASAPSSILEAKVSEDGEDDKDGDDGGESSETIEKGWDDLLIDDKDEEPLGMDTDIDTD